MIGATIVPFLLVISMVFMTRREKPNKGQLLVVRPGRRFNRLQEIGLIFSLLGVLLTSGIQIINSFHPLDPNFRAGELGSSEGYILVGFALFLFGWKRRRKSDNSLPE